MATWLSRKLVSDDIAFHIGMDTDPVFVPTTIVLLGYRLAVFLWNAIQGIDTLHASHMPRPWASAVL
jgi:hypothetical protein